MNTTNQYRRWHFHPSKRQERLLQDALLAIMLSWLPILVPPIEQWWQTKPVTKFIVWLKMLGVAEQGHRPIWIT
jgi:hypothetical protein